MMDPEFGVGILAYLFENNSKATQGKIDARIREQASKYLPYIQVEDISFSSIEDRPALAENFLGVSITYNIKKLAVRDVLEIPTN